jgi:hypothetical protein|tara:strand:+ start:2792 stop:2983 length:192 start_codon:yes stop_codon:yes gene_type:complete
LVFIPDVRRTGDSAIRRLDERLDESRQPENERKSEKSASFVDRKPPVNPDVWLQHQSSVESVG